MFLNLLTKLNKFSIFTPPPKYLINIKIYIFNTRNYKNKQ